MFIKCKYELKVFAVVISYLIYLNPSYQTSLLLNSLFLSPKTILIPTCFLYNQYY